VVLTDSRRHDAVFQQADPLLEMGPVNAPPERSHRRLDLDVHRRYVVIAVLERHQYLCGWPCRITLEEVEAWDLAQ
jgi:hypothetical protein